MAKTRAARPKIARPQDDSVFRVTRQTSSPIVITYPKDGSTVKGSEFAATGNAPTTVNDVVGVLARQDDSTKSVTRPTTKAPSPWLIFFNKDDVGSLFKHGETKLLVVLTVKDVAGVAAPQTSTFTIDTGSGKPLQGNGASMGGKKPIPKSAVLLNPNPVGTTASCPFTSSGTAPPGPLYAFIVRPGGQPIMGMMIQSAQDPSDEFVFLWQNVPAGTNYAIYYQTYGYPTQYATDGPITVQ